MVSFVKVLICCDRSMKNLHSTCTGIEVNCWSLTATRQTIKHYVIYRRVHKTRDGNIPLCAWQPELYNIIQLLTVSDTSSKAIEVAWQCAPGQSQAIRPSFRHHNGAQFRLRLWMNEKEYWVLLRNLTTDETSENWRFNTAGIFWVIRFNV